MEDRRVYSKDEVARLREERRNGHALVCPRCDAPLALAKDVKPTPTVSYVRRREWWICPTCERSAVLDV